MRILLPMPAPQLWMNEQQRCTNTLGNFNSTGSHSYRQSSSMLLQDFDAKLSDFGLALFGPQGDQSHVSSRVLGTTGYFAPEYIATGILMIDFFYSSNDVGLYILGKSYP